MKANQRLSKSHKYILTYTKKSLEKEQKAQKSSQMSWSDPTRSSHCQTRPDPSPQKNQARSHPWSACAYYYCVGLLSIFRETCARIYFCLTCTFGASLNRGQVTKRRRKNTF